ncbi:MAG: 2-oxo-tetronate isomerase [Alphaproteobacteria bacterium]
MPRFAANVTMLFSDRPYLDRHAAAARAGFRAVEVQFPYDTPAGAIASELKEHGLQQVLINMPPGDWAKGDRGMAGIPGRESEFRETVELGLHYAKVLGCPRLHVMHGLLPPRADPLACHETLVANLRHACARAAEQGATLLIEPLNPRDNPGYPVNTQAQGHAICAAVGAPNLKVQMDFYHVQIVEGDVANRVRRYLPGVGHIQIAGVPKRHEPDDGNEVNYPYLFALLDRLGWDGWVGAEYWPRGDTAAGLGWAKPWGIGG